MAATAQFDTLDAAVDFLLARIDGPLRVGAPLGLGKPHRLLNALYLQSGLIVSRAHPAALGDSWFSALGR